MSQAEEEKKAEVKKEMWKAFDALIIDDGDEVEELESEDDAPKVSYKAYVIDFSKQDPML